MHDGSRAGTRHRAEILVVEDNVQVIDLVTEFLRRAGYGVREARSSQDALTAMAAAAFDTVLLDLTLPDADGLEVLQQIRAADASVPVIILTGHLDEALAWATLRAGAFDYIEKPFTLAGLAKSVGAAVLHRQRTR